jgi:DNA-binding NtrC family response regulator
MLDPVLSRLRDAGLKVNAIKSFFCTEETEYLGYVLQEIQPQKVQAILALKHPTNVKELRTFLGIFQYYLDMREERSDMLANKAKIAWHWMKHTKRRSTTYRLLSSKT